MKDFLADTGLETETKEERKDIDFAIRKAVGKKSSDKCNVVWKEVKIWLENDEKKAKLEYELKTSFNK